MSVLQLTFKHPVCGSWECILHVRCVEDEAVNNFMMHKSLLKIMPKEKNRSSLPEIFRFPACIQ